MTGKLGEMHAAGIVTEQVPHLGAVRGNDRAQVRQAEVGAVGRDERGLAILAAPVNTCGMPVRSPRRDTRKAGPRQKPSRIIAADAPGLKPMRWSVYLMRKRRGWVAFVEAADETEALEKAKQLPEIAEADRFRLSMQRE